MGWVFRKKNNKDLRKYVKYMRPSTKNLNSHKIQTTCLISKKYSGFLTYDYKASIIDMGKTEFQNTSNDEAPLGKTDKTYLFKHTSAIDMQY